MSTRIRIDDDLLAVYNRAVMRTERNHFFSAYIYTKLFFLGLVVFLVILGFGFAKNTMARYRVQQDISTLKGEIKKLESRNTEFSQLLQYLDSEEFIKQEGRVKYGLHEQGERLVVVENKDKQEARKVVDTEPEQEASNPQKWWNYFFR